MYIKQFEYKPLAHYSYAIVSDGKMAVIDPERNPQQYYDFAKAQNAKIVAVIETHPHADFISSHLEIHRTTHAIIYNSEKLGAEYPHKPFDDGDSIQLGNITLSALNTPGHSPDSITIVAKDSKKTVLFTGDTLFIGDVGRPDLREKAGNMKAKREELAGMMYETITTRFKILPDDAIIYPAHGSGSLCGKSMSDANSSTLGNERSTNWAFKEQSKQDFMDTLLDGQPFIPIYFGYDVDVNKSGAENVEEAIANIPFEKGSEGQGVIIDCRNGDTFKKGHLKGSINIQAHSDNAQFETWLGAIVKPEEKFTLVINAKEQKDKMLHRVAKIGYEKQLKKIITIADGDLDQTDKLDVQKFKNNLNDYTIVDIRHKSEVDKGRLFVNALSYPLNELRDSGHEIPTDLPIVVHCAGGYRSAAGTSILQKLLKDVSIYDLSDDVKHFKNQKDA